MSSQASIPHPLPLRNIPVPADIVQVDGCTCGGLEMHRVQDTFDPPGSGCALWSLPHDQATVAVDAARDRLEAYVAALNARLRA